jgi:hypothetical protein
MNKLKNIVSYPLAFLWELGLLIGKLIIALLVVSTLLLIVLAYGLSMPNLRARAEKWFKGLGGDIDDLLDEVEV